CIKGAGRDCFLHTAILYLVYKKNKPFRFCRVGAERVALTDSFVSPKAQHVSPLPSPNPPCQFAGSGLSRSQPSSPKITLELVTFARFHSSALRLVRTSSNLLLPVLVAFLERSHTKAVSTFPYAASTAFHTCRIIAPGLVISDISNCPFLILFANSIPLNVTFALPKFLNPSIG